MKKGLIILSLVIGVSIVYGAVRYNSNPPKEHSTMKNKSVEKIVITIEDNKYQMELESNTTAQKFLETLPFESISSEYHDNHYYGTTPIALPINGVPTTNDCKKGYLYYSDQFKGFGLFYDDGYFEDYELILIGKITIDLTTLDTSKKQHLIKFGLVD